MAHKILLLKFLLLITISSTNSIYAQYSHEHYDFKSLDINNIVINPNNLGRLDIRGGDIGAIWNLIPFGFPAIVYDIGPWIVGKIDDSLYAAMSQWRSLYSPGPVINGQAGILINPQDSLKYRVYKISEGDDNSNIDFADWPSDLGAPTTLKRSPLVLGDQTIWTVYNNADSTISNRVSYFGEYWKPFPVEIQQTIFAHSGFADDSVNIFSNVVFIEWTIINKGNKKIDSSYFGFWTDIDFGHAFDNFPAIDTINQLAYCWSPDSSMCVGFSLLYGPIQNSTGDEATFRGKSKEDYRNLPITSFHGIADDAAQHPLLGPANKIIDTWYFPRGLDADGNIIIDPFTNDTTLFPFNGDPVTNQGWMYPYNSTGGGAGYVFFSGPFDMEPQDTQWVMIALIPALGNDPFQSITNMREKAQILHSLPYDSIAFGDYGLPREDPILIPENYLLYQNYPNPFNQGTVIKYELPSPGNVSLKIYDILGREVAKLVDEFQNEGEYIVGFNPSSLASGVYIYRLRVNDFVETKKMVLLK